MSQFRLSPAPAPVNAAAPVAALGDQTGGGSLTLSPPPPDIVGAVAPVAEIPSVPGARALDDFDVPDVLPPGLHDAEYSQAPDLAALEFGPRTTVASAPLTNEEAFRIALAIAPVWSGEEAWSAVGADTEFRSVGHPAAGIRHFGLSFGLLAFTQESGLLGRVLELFRTRDAAAFSECFGADADALLATTTASTAAERLAPVGGSELPSEVWLARFRAAGASAPCQYAQNEVAVELVVRPAAAAAAQLGLDTDRGIAMAADLVVAEGSGRGLRSIVALAAPFSSRHEADAALAATGTADLAGFQRSVGVPESGLWDAPTVAALIAAHHRVSSDETQGRLVANSSGLRRRRLLGIRSNGALDDRALAAGTVR